MLLYQFDYTFKKTDPSEEFERVFNINLYLYQAIKMVIASSTAHFIPVDIGGIVDQHCLNNSQFSVLTI